MKFFVKFQIQGIGICAKPIPCCKIATRERQESYIFLNDIT